MKTLNRNPKRSMKVLVAVFLAVAVATGWAVFSGRMNCGGAKAQAKRTIYTCAMHHQIRRDKPGDCPICGMTLIPLAEDGTPGVTPRESKASQPGVKKIKYWANPMNPAQHSPKPMKDDMGMDFVPVYEDAAVGVEAQPDALKGLAPVRMSPYKQQLIGVRFATAWKAPITRVIHTNGRFAGGSGDFAAMAGDFAARSPLSSSGQYVVADVYALDLPFVEVGQKAVVTALSGSGNRVEGRVSHIYPYDETQSRVTRVRINLAQSFPGELFANVDIEAITGPKLAVPPTAVMDTGNHRYVFLQTESGIFVPREITVGFQGTDLWEVASGLKEGDQVVDGANFLIDADSKITASFAEEK